MASPRIYVVTSGLTSLAASTRKVACQIATPATATCVPFKFSITGDSVATGAGAIPWRVQVVRPTAVGSGGATFTPSKADPSIPVASEVTARINDTTAGASPLILEEFLLSPTAGLAPYEFSLGREFGMTISDFLEINVLSQAGMTTCNYVANLWYVV